MITDLQLLLLSFVGSSSDLPIFVGIFHLLLFVICMARWTRRTGGLDSILGKLCLVSPAMFFICVIL